MINYILQVILFQVLFLAVYDFFLCKETFFTKNRWYLLGTTMVSFLIPLIKIPNFQKAVSQEFIVILPEIVLSPEKTIQRTFQETTIDTSLNYIAILFWIGVAFFSIVFLVKLFRIFSLIENHEKIKNSNFTLIFIPNQTNAFSFFNYIFLGKEIPKIQQEKIIQHENIHNQQKHSIDLLLFEFLKIVMWFNPMIYLYQKRISLVHEYISDEFVVKLESKETYINNLLSCLFQVENISFINQFHKPSYLKKRILMMTKNQSQKMNQLKYLVLIPVLLSMLFYSACSESEYLNKQDSKKEIFKMYTLSKDGTLKSFETDKESYLDIFIGDKIPNGFMEISEQNLTDNETIEFNDIKVKFSSLFKDNDFLKTKIFKIESGRKVIAAIYNHSKMKGNFLTSEKLHFYNIDKAPTFPGCNSGDKDCFSKNIQKHFAANFNADLPKTLSLESGKKKVFISFKISSDGNVQDIKVKAPHFEIQNEVIRVMSSLPKMIPGEHEGKKIAVKYSIPFTINIE